RACARRQREGSVLPDRLAPAHQEASGEVVRGKVVVTGDRDERPPEPPRHVTDEACLAAAGRPLEHDGQPAAAGCGEPRDLVLARPVMGLGRYVLERMVDVGDGAGADGPGPAHALARMVPRGGRAAAKSQMKATTPRAKTTAVPSHIR